MQKLIIDLNDQARNARAMCQHLYERALVRKAQDWLDGARQAVYNTDL